jgi:hypothetical protein
MECDQRRCWITGQGKYWLSSFASASWNRNGSKCGGLPGLDCDTPEVNGAIEMPFYDGLKEIGWTHRSSSCGQEYIRPGYTFLNSVDMGCYVIRYDTQVNNVVPHPFQRGL